MVHPCLVRCAYELSYGPAPRPQRENRSALTSVSPAMRLPFPLLGAVVVVVAAAGCGGGNSSSSSQTESTSSPSSGGTVVKTVTISETEYKLTPSSVKLSKPGTYVFKAVNKGTVTHALEIEGNGVEEKTGDIAAGQSATLKVELKKAGSYEMYCPVDGHKDQGMEGKIAIGSSGAGSGGMTTQETTTSETKTGYGY
jgi:plastocyanin